MRLVIDGNDHQLSGELCLKLEDERPSVLVESNALAVHRLYLQLVAKLRYCTPEIYVLALLLPVPPSTLTPQYE